MRNGLAKWELPVFPIHKEGLSIKILDMGVPEPKVDNPVASARAEAALILTMPSHAMDGKEFLSGQVRILNSSIVKSLPPYHTTR